MPRENVALVDGPSRGPPAAAAEPQQGCLKRKREGAAEASPGAAPSAAAPGTAAATAANAPAQPAKKPRREPLFRYAPGWVMSAYTHAIKPANITPAFVKDCKAVFKKKSFWIDWDATPRCQFERFALDVFRKHYARTGLRENPPADSGAEWWVQIRSNAPGSDESLGFHWDRDEEHAVETSGKSMVCPSFSTVTYITAVGAPTAVVPLAPIAAKGKRPFSKMYVSHPEAGKHIVFRGDGLHGCPPEMMKKTGGKKQSYTRVTLLVNVWVGHHPMKVEVAPDSLFSGLATRDAGALFEPGVEAELPMLQPGSSSPVVGFQFGRKGVEDHHLWLPVPPKKAASHSSFAMACPSVSKLVKL